MVAHPAPPGDIARRGLPVGQGWRPRSCRSRYGWHGRNLAEAFAAFRARSRSGCNCAGQGNIELGKTEPPNCIWSALEQVELKDKVNTLPHTYDTPITSQLYADGIELSGGESQKLAISRIYARNAQVIAMDEPTSSLDPKSEFTLYQQILNNTKPNAIVIIVSHRLTLTYKMSKIIVLEHGQVKEQGTHNELIKLNGIYKELYSMQANKYTTNM